MTKDADARRKISRRLPGVAVRSDEAEPEVRRRIALASPRRPG